MSTWWRALLHLLGVRAQPTSENDGLVYASAQPLGRTEVSFSICCEMCGTRHKVSVGMEPLR